MNRNEAIEIVRKYYPDDRCLLFNEALETLVPELKESENEDEIIRNRIIGYFKQDIEEHPERKERIEDMLAWIKKQGEQNTAPFKAEHGKYYYCIKDYFCGGKKWASKGDVIQALRGLPIMGLDDASEFFLPVNDIQLNNNINHNDRPKFKVGDWIVYDKYGTKDIDRIVKFDHDIVRFESSTWLFVNQLNKDCKLWTIEDAKDGDVLCCENGWTCIFKALNNHNKTFSSYCFMDSDKWFCDTGGECHTLDEAFIKAYNGGIHPATTEQRCLLFQTMKEKGYEWDNENKILTKIELVPTPKYQEGDWLICDDFTPIRVDCVDLKEQKYYLSNGDIRPSEMLDNNPYIRLWSIRDAKYGDVLYNYEGSTGVEAIHLVKGWEDVEGTGRTLCSIATYRVLDNEVIKGGLGAIWWEGNPLEFRPATEEERKKLLEKMMFFKKKQKTWKPTREQLRQLDAVINAYAKGSKTHTELRSLSEDLKKLK